MNATTQTDCKNEASEMSLAFKRVKLENNELKFKLDTERRQFQVEKDKWLLEKQRVIQYQNYLQQKSQHQQQHSNDSGSSNYVNNMKQVTCNSMQHSQSTDSAIPLNREQMKKDLNTNTMHFLQQKLASQQKQQQQCQSDYYKSNQISNQAKLYSQGLLADSRATVVCNQRATKQQNYL